MEGNPDIENRGGVSDVATPFLIAAAHELKSPLALIRQLSLGLETGDLDQKDIARLSHQITLTSERALRLTTDLTRAYRLEDALFQLEPLNPVALCEEVVREMQPLYEARRRRIIMSSHATSMIAIANRELLRRVMLGFADNALHYNDESVPVVVTAMGKGRMVRLGVRDYGPGLSVKTWKRLVSNLGVSPQPLQTRPESSGLGMYIAGQFASAMNASVGAVRHRDGATFYIDLSASTQMRLL